MDEDECQGHLAFESMMWSSAESCIPRKKSLGTYLGSVLSLFRPKVREKPPKKLLVNHDAFAWVTPVTLVILAF